MSNYTKAFNWTNKRGTVADPADLDTEFANIQTAVNSKADSANPTFTGTVTLPADSSVSSQAGLTGLFAVPANHIYMHAFKKATKMVFFQATAPIGWTQVTTQNDKFLRVVNTTGGTVGGQHPASQGVPANTDAHTLTVQEIPAHTHTAAQKAGTNNIWQGGTWAPYGTVSYASSTTTTSGSTGGGQGHTHGINNGQGWIPKYIDVILCQKD